ncbi:unnamed protein product [Didymodactylos carnosus]|uniref:3'-5' exonuclease domain-containing protein n=1 Tax=Didymodactylos carnosus TaxID=1234261 RepID=A0A815IBN9_9BILA|nr:unnamed protein product [Didymodactylos carnosus]CAF1363737.1 unnamed protein product [Didymodactylos carnosus]CAF3690145.1 unnamed protein product [Didymodactylos carnosus]CAF4244281.1 unnamed protein product [Didymodactylos carnosus]
MNLSSVKRLPEGAIVAGAENEYTDFDSDDDYNHYTRNKKKRKQSRTASNKNQNLIKIQPCQRIQKAEPHIENDYKYVDTSSRLKQMMGDIENQSEISVDSERHTYRSYKGYTCLMQISTRTTDYIVDPLGLRSELHALNNVFKNAKVVKVFHDAASDVEWLQKDFGLYVVNIFDTFQASRELNLPSHSLAYLLKHYCGVDANKEYQTADWRRRKLEEKFCQIASKKYEPKEFDPNDYDRLLKGIRDSYSDSERSILKSLYAWRERV